MFEAITEIVSLSRKLLLFNPNLHEFYILPRLVDDLSWLLGRCSEWADFSWLCPIFGIIFQNVCKIGHWRFLASVDQNKKIEKIEKIHFSAGNLIFSSWISIVPTYSALQKNSFFSSTLYKIACSSYGIKDT